MSSKYVDTTAIIQVIGCVFNSPSLLDYEDKYNITQDDFPDKFHQIIFGSIYKLHEAGVKDISLLNIEDFLNTRPNSYDIFKAYRGGEWIKKASDCAALSSFDYYYARLKKFTLLRAYDNIGVNVVEFYDPDNIIDFKKKQEQEERLDNLSIIDIANKINDRIEAIKEEYADGFIGDNYQAGEGIFDLIESLKEHPEYGLPLYGGSIINEITRGARKKKLYLRSAASGIGKSRAMVADACFLSCGEIYYDNVGWIKHSEIKAPSLFISTELTLKEVQTLLLAFLSNVNEDKIIDGNYEGDEEERVLHAAELIENSPLYIEIKTDFSLQDIENLIKKNIRDNKIEFVFYDYLHTSMKILEEISQRTKGMSLREDNVLFMLSNTLKNICNDQNVFIMTATQLSGDFRNSDTPDQQLLRGAKSIADWTRLDKYFIKFF